MPRDRTDPRGRPDRCRSWEEVKFVRGLSSENLVPAMNKLARSGWLVHEPEPENDDVGTYGAQTYTLKATRDWCICGMEIQPDD